MEQNTEILVGKKFLVVDDEPEICETIADELMDSEVDTAHSYDEGRRKLTEGTYDLVILDIMGVRGQELLAEFGQKFPCIMLTAHALNLRELEKAIHSGSKLFLPKTDLSILEGCLCELLAGDNQGLQIYAKGLKRSMDTE